MFFFHYLLSIDCYGEKRYFSRTIALLEWLKICMKYKFKLDKIGAEAPLFCAPLLEPTYTYFLHSHSKEITISIYNSSPSRLTW
jgi:hypothetical protein